MTIVAFRDRGTEDVFNGVHSKAARKVCPPELTERARSKLFLIDDAESLGDLRAPPGNRLEALCLRWTESGAQDVGIVDYHS